MLTLDSLYSFMSSLPMATLLLDKDGNIKLANSNAEQMLNVSHSLLKKESIYVFFNQNNILRLIKNVIKDETSCSEYSCILTDYKNSEQSVDIHLSKCLEKNILFMIQERTIVKKAVDEVKTNSFGILKGLTNAFTNSIKNPVTSVLGASELLNSQLNKNTSNLDKELLHIINKESYLIKGFIENLNLISGSIALNKKKINIHEVINKTITKAKIVFSQNLDFSLLYDPSLPDLDIDEKHMSIAFYNIIKNSIEAKSDNKIIISTSINHTMYSDPSISSERIKLPVQITFQDKGPGINKTIKNDIFQPFISTKNNFNGLGLTYALQVIELHKGLIKFDSNSNKTNFHIFLPLMIKSVKQ